jgi:GDP-L-fucose synthase
MIRKFHEAKVAGDREVALWGDGTPTREFLYVDDCAEAFVAAMEKYDGPDPINVGTGIEITMMDLAKTVQSVVGHAGEIRWDSTRPNGQPRRCLDVSRAERLLGWKAKTPFREGLVKTYEWYLSNLPKT